MAAELNKTILLIEDEISQREPIAQMLLGHGFTVLQAPDGKQGLKAALENHPDLILLDLVMPEMDGVSFTKELRADSWGSSVPLIMLTNVSPDTENTIKTIDEYKPSYYLTKADVSLDDIVTKIKSLLNL